MDIHARVLRVEVVPQGSLGAGPRAQLQKDVEALRTAGVAEQKASDKACNDMAAAAFRNVKDPQVQVLNIATLAARRKWARKVDPILQRLKGSARLSVTFPESPAKIALAGPACRPARGGGRS